MFVLPRPPRVLLALISTRRRRVVTIMVVFSIAFISLITMMDTVDAGVAAPRGNKWGIKKTNVPGFFMQDLEDTIDTTFDYAGSNFGLLDTFGITELSKRYLGVVELKEGGDKGHDGEDGDDEEKKEVGKEVNEKGKKKEKKKEKKEKKKEKKKDDDDDDDEDDDDEDEDEDDKDEDDKDVEVEDVKVEEVEEDAKVEEEVKVVEAEKKKAPWKNFKKAIENLNKKAPKNTAYKVLYLARHGQGYHNVAESYYGTPLWDCYWSLQDGNGTSRWDDAELTSIGIAEAQKANLAFKDQVKSKIPLPDVYYSSPLSRASSTLQITWDDITLNSHKTPKPIFKEKLRETLGIHTCDRRNTKTYLEGQYPKFTFEEGFAETDKLWDPVYREPDDARNIRLGAALDEIFVENKDATYISITAHSGAIRSILAVIGHRKFSLQTGGVIPVVVKVEYIEETPTSTSVSPSGTAPACTVDPTATSL